SGARGRATLLRRVGARVLPLRDRRFAAGSPGPGPDAEPRAGVPPHLAPRRRHPMNALAVVLAVVALIALAVLTCVLAAALRALDRPRAAVAALRADPHDAFDVLGNAIPVGDLAPAFAATAADGAPYSSADLEGTLRLLAFARPGCPPCEELVPALVRDVE